MGICLYIRRFCATFALFAVGALVQPRAALALDPEGYGAAVRRLAIWLAQTTDPSTLHPASPVGVMPYEIQDGHPLPEFYGVAASYGYSQYKPNTDVASTLSGLTGGVPLPAQFRSNKLTASRGFSRRSTIGLHVIQYPAFETWGGGIHFERVLLTARPLFLTWRNSASRAAGSGLFDYTGLLTEAVIGLHWTGVDLFAGVGTRLARVKLEVAGGGGGNQWLLPHQRESLETHVGAEVFLTKRWAIGGGVHFHPGGTGFGVRIIYKSRGTSPLLDPYLGKRRE